MKMKSLLLAAYLLIVAPIAMATISEADLRQFEKGKTTIDQVINKLGPPTQTQYTDEGIRIVAFLESGAHLNDASTASLLGAVAAIFIPGAAGLAVSAASVATGSLAGGAEGKSTLAAFVFDKHGVLVYYMANVQSISSGSFGTKSSLKTISSDDGAMPMREIKVQLTEEQRKSPVSTSQKDKPRLGITLIPVNMLTDEALKRNLTDAKFVGMIVAYVADGSAAGIAGLQEGDYLILLNGVLVKSYDDVAKAMSSVSKGDEIKLHARRIDRNAHLWKEAVFTVKF